jgi:transposase-like protein
MKATKRKVPSKTKRAQAFLESNPAAAVNEVANRFGLSKQAIYGLRNKMKREGFVFPKKSEQLATLAPAAPVDDSVFLKKLGIDPVKYAQAVESLQEAKMEIEMYEDEVDATLDARAVDYGKFIEGAEVMQMLKRVVQVALNNRDKVLAHDQAEAMDMIIHKIGRIVNGNPDVVDHWLDIAGYAKLVADRLEGRVR